MIIGFTIESQEEDGRASFRFVAQYASEFPALFLDIGLVHNEAELKKLCERFSQNTDWKHRYIVKPDVEFVNENVKFVAEDKQSTRGASSFDFALKYFASAATTTTTSTFPISHSVDTDTTNYDCALKTFNHAETLQRFLVQMSLFLDLNDLDQWWMEIGNAGKDVEVLILGLEGLDLVGAEEVLFKVTKTSVIENPYEIEGIKTWKNWAIDINWSPLAPLDNKDENENENKGD